MLLCHGIKFIPAGNNPNVCVRNTVNWIQPKLCHRYFYKTISCDMDK